LLVNKVNYKIKKFLRISAYKYTHFLSFTQEKFVKNLITALFFNISDTDLPLLYSKSKHKETFVHHKALIIALPKESYVAGLGTVVAGLGTVVARLGTVVAGLAT
jgi:hypothetical protein